MCLGLSTVTCLQCSELSPPCDLVQVYLHPFCWAFNLKTYVFQSGKCIESFLKNEFFPFSLHFLFGTSIVWILDLQDLSSSCSYLFCFSSTLGDKSLPLNLSSNSSTQFFITDTFFHFLEIFLLFSEFFDNLLFVCQRCHIFSSLRIL